MNTSLYTLPNGYTAEMYPDVADNLIFDIWEKQCYTSHFPLKPGHTVIDIGANQGVFSLFAASQGARVYAIEPDHRNFNILCKNITRNNLSELITPVFGAVGSRPGTATLFIPGLSDGVHPSTFASTSGSWFESLPEPVHPSETQTVPVFTLENILTNHHLENADLMKMDIEGGEFDILASLDTATTNRIRAIAMETHDTYEEKELFWTVKKLGFSIPFYEKRQGPFKTGFIHAIGRPVKTEDRFEPVAIVDIPCRVTTAEEICIDASKSFSTVNENGTLTFSLSVNDKTYPPSECPVFKIRIPSPGSNQIRITVSEKTAQNDTSRESIEKNIWVFSERYSVAENAVRIDKINSDYRFNIHGTRNFVIPASSIPADWDFSSIVLSITLKDLDGSPDEISRLKVRMHINGTVIDFDSNFKELYFSGFPKNTLFAFSLESDTDTDIQIKWYASDQTAPQPITILNETSKGLRKNPESGGKYICCFEGDSEILIEKQMFPQNYRVRTFNICFTVHPDDTTGKSLQGSVTIDGTRHILDGWYIQLTADYAGYGNDLRVAVTVPEKRWFQITWWP